MPNATLSTTDPTCTDLGLRDERPATNRLSHGMAYLCNEGIFCFVLGRD
jgi:hypothetical protein